MIIYLAGVANTRGLLDEYLKKKKVDIPILGSFHYVNGYHKKIIPYLEHFLLDSGAFTFMNSRHKSKVDWNNYLQKYIDFINEYDIKYFFELDIDVVVGYDRVREMRKILETKTGKRCIPVWHKSRGLEEWYKLTKEYDYVAIGGFVIKEIKKTEYKFIPKFLEIAKKNNCKVHGLGFTNFEGLKKCKFYSVDSTTWINGQKFGEVQKFDGRTLKKYQGKNQRRLKNVEKAVINNFNEWVKFSEYAKTHL